MKKKIAFIIISSLILISISSCSGNIPENEPEVQGTVSTANSTTTKPESEAPANTGGTNAPPESEISISETTPTEKVIEIYGEAEIPNIPCGSDTDEGKASTITDSEALKQCLDSMVFETHTFGDYKVSLVGDSVRIDKENFPDSIYTQELRIEVEKNGAKISGDGYYCDTFVYVSQFTVEYRLFTDKIGSYIDIYMSLIIP